MKGSMLSPISYFVLLLYGTVNFCLGTNEKCLQLTADIVFAVDSSFSIKHSDYHKQLTFLRAAIDQFTLGHNHVQIGVVSFASTARMDIKLNAFTNKRDLKEAIRIIPQMRGGTNTHKAIQFIHTALYQPDNGGRPWAKKQLVLITDGLSSNTSATLLEASIARSIGIEVFSILVGEGVDDIEIRGTASEPKELHMFRVESYKALVGIGNALSRATCQSLISFDGRIISDKEYTEQDNSIDKQGPAHTDCEMNTADVIFLMDSSSSIWEPDFKTQIKFIQKVISNFDLGEKTTRVGVVVYSDAPITLVDLSDKQAHEYIHKTLTKAPYITGGTNTALAINHVRKNILVAGVARSNVAHLMIILSDGLSNDMNQTIEEAHRAREEGVKVFSIGIGQQTDVSELMAMASIPADQFVFHVNDYPALSEIQDLLALKACKAATILLQEVACLRLPTDVVFIYDMAALSWHHHDIVINIISEVTQSKRLNKDELRVGVMRDASEESSFVLHDIELTNQWDESIFKTRLDPGLRAAAVHILFQKARHTYFHPTIQFDYITHKRTIVLFIDSQLQNHHAALIEALRLRKSHVNIVVVSLGKHADMEEINKLASSPSSFYIINATNVQAHHIRYVVSKLIAILCY